MRHICTILLAIVYPLCMLAQDDYDYSVVALYNKLHEPDPNKSIMLITDCHYSIQNIDGCNTITVFLSFNDQKAGEVGTVQYSMKIPTGVKRVKLSFHHMVVYYKFHNYIMLDYPSDYWLSDSKNVDNPFKYKQLHVSDTKYFEPNLEPTRVRYRRSEFTLKDDGHLTVYISVRKRDISRYLEPFIGNEGAQRFEWSEKDDKWWK